MQRKSARDTDLLASLASLCVSVSLILAAPTARGNDEIRDSASTFSWQSTAKLHHGLKAASGTLVFGKNGIEFHSENPRISHVWPYLEVKTLALSPHRVIITDYGNRGHRLPGERRFPFDLSTPLPSSIAARLAQEVGKPIQNADPEAKVAAYLSIPARHGARFGGTNGTLRFRDDAIDYVSAGGHDSRSWRWSDIQTLANPTPYRLRVGAYLETFEFELKQPISPEVFDRLWDHVYADELNVKRAMGGERHAN